LKTKWRKNYRRLYCCFLGIYFCGLRFQIAGLQSVSRHHRRSAHPDRINFVLLPIFRHERVGKIFYRFVAHRRNDRPCQCVVEIYAAEKNNILSAAFVLFEVLFVAIGCGLANYMTLKSKGIGRGRLFSLAVPRFYPLLSARSVIAAAKRFPLIIPARRSWR